MGANSNLHPIRPLKSQRPSSGSQFFPQKEPRAGDAGASRGRPVRGSCNNRTRRHRRGRGRDVLTCLLSLDAVEGLTPGLVSQVLCLHMVLTSKIKGEPGFLAFL